MKRILLILPLFLAFFVFSAIGVLAEDNEQEEMQDPTVRILNQIKERSQNKAEDEDEDVEDDENESIENDEDEKPEKPLTAQERLQKIQELKVMAKEEKCELLGDRIDGKIEKYNAGYTKYIQNFENLHQRVEDLLVSLEGQDYDTAAVEANNDKLMEYIDEMKKMHEEFVTKMDDSREPSCLDNAKQFQNIVKEAKGLLTQTRAMAKEMHTFVREELRPSLQQLRIQIAGEEEEEVDDANNVEDSEGNEDVDDTNDLEDSKVDDDSAVEGVEDSYYRNYEY